MLASILFAACVTVFPVLANPGPSEPAPGETFNQGSNCHIAWDADTTGIWKTMNIELMTGDNLNMVHLSTVATLDGTDASKTTFDYPCLGVTPNSPIYFYQFSSPAAPGNNSWTGRFAIADAAGDPLTPPANNTQPTGEPIPWGTGQLLDASQGTPPPAGASSNSSTPPAGASPSAPSIPGPAAPASSAPAASPPAASPSAAARSSAAAVSNTGEVAAAPSTTPPPANSNANAAPHSHSTHASIALISVALVFASFL